MASPAVSKNTWILDTWYAQAVADGAGYVGSRTLWSWGYQGQGMLGLNEPQGDNKSSPTQIGTADDWRKIGYKGAANEYTLCLRTDYKPGSGTCYGWGQNNKGQLGLSNTVYRSSPTQTYQGSDWEWNEVASGNEISIGMLTSGKLHTWGNNNYGQLGLNQSTPTTKDDPGSSLGPGWAVGTHKIAAGSYNCLAIKTDASLWTWGSNLYGALGLSESTPGNDKSSPVQIPGSWKSIHGCAQCFGGVKTDGTLWTWGNNANGNLGHNNKTQYSSPKQIPGTEWQRASFGPSAGAFLKTTGELRMCGANNSGQLGQNSTTQYSSPRQVSGTWTKIMDGQYSHMGAIKSDGSLFVWGGNAQGQLGQNQNENAGAQNYSSPKQIPGTYIDIQGGNNYMIAIRES